MRLNKYIQLSIVLSLTLSHSNPLFGQISNPSERILGTWYSENDDETKWVYQGDGTLEVYGSNTLKYTYMYQISHECGINTDSKFFFMKWIDKDGDSQCMEINGVDENSSGILSLTNLQNGKVYLYTREALAGPDD